MTVEPLVVLTIALMALVTYATRAGGLWLASRLELSERAGRWLEGIPGAILVSIVAPVVLTAGLAEALAALAVVLVAARTGSLLGAMLTGVIVVVALRAVLPI